MRSVTAVAAVSGPMVLVAYLVASAVGTRTAPMSRRRWTDNLLEAVVAVGLATLAWAVAKRLSPGGSIRYSNVAFFSDDVLAAWQSVALWAGLGSVAGTVAPVFRRFRGGHGTGAAVGLWLVYTPALAVVWALGFGTGLVLRGDEHEARLLGLAPVLPLAWLAWLFGWPPGWGLPLGPEVTLWTMVVTAVLFARWWIDHQQPTAPAAP